MRINAHSKMKQKKEKTEPMNISIPASLKRETRKHPEVNWSAVARRAFEHHLRAQKVLAQFEEEGVTEDEAIERALHIQHQQKIVKTS
jgi:hypothetical protein